MKSVKVVFGVMGGIAAGAALGMLFAPKKGSKTRKLIARKGEGFAETIKEKINAVLVDIKEQCETFCHEAEFMVTKEKIKVDVNKGGACHDII